MSTLGKRRTFKDLKRKPASKRAISQNIDSRQSDGRPKKAKLDFRFEATDLTDRTANLRSLDLENYSCSSLIYGSSPADVLTTLVCKFGFKTICSLVKAIDTVPVRFPSRNSYISNIVNCYGPTGVNIEFLVEVLNHFHDELKYVSCTEHDQILWDTTAKHNEPHNAFLLPPVEHCIHNGCDGALYVHYKCFATLFSMNGPIPAQKATLRCRECNTTYNIDTFSTPKEGTRIYPFQTQWHAASNRVYFSTDVHELMCEAG